MVSAFLAGHPVTGQDEGERHDAADMISSAAAVWRMPVGVGDGLNFDRR